MDKVRYWKTWRKQTEPKENQEKDKMEFDVLNPETVYTLWKNAHKENPWKYSGTLGEHPTVGIRNCLATLAI